MDQWLLKFVGENWMTIYIALTMLKGVAILTPTVKDDQIVTLLSTAYGMIKSGKAPESLP